MRNAILFFRVVPPVPPLMTSTFVVVTVASMLVVVVDPRRATGVLTAIALLQLFAAASGFAGPARRGYYDLLFTRGDRWLVIGVAQWLMSIAAGMASWVAIAGVETAVTGAPVQSFAPGTVTAMLLVSTVPWAMTVALPRFAGAVGWLVVMVMASTLVPQLLPPARVWWVEAAAVLLLPGSFIGAAFSTGSVVPGPALACALASMCVALRWIARADVPLETAQ